MRFTAAWILCHEGTLIRSLLDPVFLPGFAGARVLRTAAVLAEQAIRAHAAELEAQADAFAPLVRAVLDAGGVLMQARDAGTAALQACGPAQYGCFSSRLTPLDWERIKAWFALAVVVQNALQRLADDVENGANEVAAMTAFLTVVGSEVPVRRQFDVYLAVNEYFGMFGDTDGLDPRFSVPDDVLSLDDGGLRAAVQRAAEGLSTAAAAAAASVMPSVGPDEDAAAARVEFERLRCHLRENRLHYSQAVWAQEDHADRFLRLQSYGPIATIIENRLLGFHGDRAAYPLRDLSVIASVDLEAMQNEAEQVIRGATRESVLISLPTSGQIFEAVTGECNACESYITESRLSDLRSQSAAADQAEVETKRREERVRGGDYEDPVAPPGPLVVEVRNVGGTGTSGPDGGG